jgi:transposase InsO family protein
VSRYRWIDDRKAEGLEMTAACRTAQVSVSAYYDWAQRVSAGPSDTECDEAILVNEMLDVHRHLDASYGSPRMTAELRRRSHCVNHKRTERLMSTHGIVASDGRRRKVRTTIPDVTAPPVPDLVRRDFTVGAPGQRSCGDITYIPTTEGFLYLAHVLDLGSRRVIGFAMGEHMALDIDMLKELNRGNF